MKQILSRKIVMIVLLGILLQFCIMPLTYHGDMTNYDGWGRYMLDQGPAAIYDFDFGAQLLSDANYPPLMLWTCAGLSFLMIQLRHVIWQLNLLIPVFPSGLVALSESALPYIFTFKLLLVLINAGIAIFVYLWIRQILSGSYKTALTASVLIMGNPALIYGTTVWGQIDMVPVFFLIAGLYVLFHKKQVVLSSILVVTALLFKQTIILFFPLHFLVLWKYFGIKNLIKATLSMATTLWVIYAPFVSSWTHVLAPFERYIYNVQLASDNAITTKSAWNIWVLFHGLKPVSDLHPIFGGISFQLIGYLAVLATLVYIVMVYVKSKKVSLREGAWITWYACFLIALGSFLFLTRLHERHLLQVLPFLVIISLAHKRGVLHFLFVTCYALLNMVIVWDPFRLSIQEGTVALAVIRLSVIGFVFLFLFYFWRMPFFVQRIRDLKK